MRTREEKYATLNELPKRTNKNKLLYERLNEDTQKLEDNVKIYDNVNIIDVEKIKEMVGNRENNRRLRNYREFANIQEQEEKAIKEVTIEDMENRKYDINEILEQKKSNKNNDYEEEKIRKISETQHNILKGLDLKPKDSKLNEGKLEDMINTIVDKKLEEVNLSKTNFDFFENLKEDPNIEEKKETEFYSKEQSFKKEDFEKDYVSKKDKNLLFKIIVSILLLLIVVVVFFIILIL